MVVLDTNHFSELLHSSELGRNLALRMEGLDVFSCIVAAEESLQGWISYVAKHKAGDAQFYPYKRLQAAIEALNKFGMLPFDHDAIAVFHRLQAQRIRIGTMDLKIASICIAHDALLLSRNLVDFEKIPGLRVENWLD